MPRGIGKLTNLQMLGAFAVGKDSIRDAAAGLNELSKLTGLRKELTIRCLERIVPSGLGASFSIEKLALQSLTLSWHLLQATEADAVEVLERFRPHPDLKKLSIQGYHGVRPSSWISQLHKLVEIRFFDCEKCVRLPPLDQLPSLKGIHLSYLSNFQWIKLSESESGTPQSNSFPSLEEIWLESLPKFRGWERSRSSSRIEQEEEATEEDDDDSLLMLPVFSDKVKVTRLRCRRFSYMQGQELPSSSRMMARLISPSSISLLAPTGLTISEVEDLEHLPELLQSLPSLQSLAIMDCPLLKAPPVWAILRCLTALESLGIYRCRDLDLSTGESGYQEDMPEGPAYKLRELEFLRIDKMETLPWWIQHLTNLESLKIRSCWNLKAFPEWFPQLTSLKRLEISNSGEKLRRRCRRDIGEDWPKISHIPDIDGGRGWAP
ncbi:putative disease resistance protein RGA4 [Punica granatum]|uniref:Disease resistance protein RGA4 n=1 Tax=Punica granatum TaxID=22663 RepID=A0A6P8CHK7_PUNGR|nr:putative disease resistance protein RGA4 [Punica granatum]